MTARAQTVIDRTSENQTQGLPASDGAQHSWCSQDGKRTGITDVVAPMTNETSLGCTDRKPEVELGGSHQPYALGMHPENGRRSPLTGYYHRIITSVLWYGTVKTSE